MKNYIQILIYFTIIFTIYINVFAKENVEDITVKNNVSIYNKLVFDATNEKVIDYYSIINNKEDKYLYSTEFDNFEIIITNLPKENNLQIYTIKKIDKEKLKFTVEENENIYNVDKSTKIEFIYPYNSDNSKLNNNFNQISKYTKVLVDFDNRNNVEKLFITPFKSLGKSILNNKAINIEGKFIEQIPYFINDKLYLPIRPIAEVFNYNIYWNEELKIVTLEKNNKKIEIKTNYSNFIKNNSVYVPEDLIKDILQINISLKDNIIYVG